METKDLIWECIWEIEHTFSKDDIENVSRDTLEQLIYKIDEKLHDAVEEDIPWWDKPDPDELANFQIELISVR